MAARLASITLLAFALGCAVDEQTGLIWARVVDVHGQPIPRARVIAREKDQTKSGIADAVGVARLPVRRGEWIVNAELPGVRPGGESHVVTHLADTSYVTLVLDLSKPGSMVVSRP